MSTSKYTYFSDYVNFHVLHMYMYMYMQGTCLKNSTFRA
jgi:hypothetical protein